MTHTITTLATLTEPLLRPLLVSLSVAILSEATDHGFTTVTIECNSDTADMIRSAGFEVAT
jgi:hypothetical protein